MIFRMVQNMDRYFFRFVTIHSFDRRTDRQIDRQTDSFLIARPRLHSMQRGNNVMYALWLDCILCLQFYVKMTVLSSTVKIFWKYYFVTCNNTAEHCIYLNMSIHTLYQPKCGNESLNLLHNTVRLIQQVLNRQHCLKCILGVTSPLQSSDVIAPRTCRMKRARKLYCRNSEHFVAENQEYIKARSIMITSSVSKEIFSNQNICFISLTYPCGVAFSSDKHQMLWQSDTFDELTEKIILLLAFIFSTEFFRPTFPRLPTCLSCQRQWASMH